MSTLKEQAKTYVKPTTKNISELDKIPIDIELLDGTGQNKKGETFKYKYVLVDNEEYRVPGTVIGGIKGLLSKIPNLKFVSVIKSGTTKEDTSYQVIPIQEEVGGAAPAGPTPVRPIASQQPAAHNPEQAAQQAKVNKPDIVL